GRKRGHPRRRDPSEGAATRHMRLHLGGCRLRAQMPRVLHPRGMPLSRRVLSWLHASGAPRALGSSLFGLVFLATTASAAEEPRCTNDDLPIPTKKKKINADVSEKRYKEYLVGVSAKTPAAEKEKSLRDANETIRCHPETVFALAKLLDEQGRLGEAL